MFVAGDPEEPATLINLNITITNACAAVILFGPGSNLLYSGGLPLRMYGMQRT